MKRKWLIDLRTALGKTQKQVAKENGISESRFCEIENGSFPRGKMAKQLADYYGVRMDRFYEDSVQEFATASPSTKGDR